MSERSGIHPLVGTTGLFAFALWLFYSLYALLHYPVILTSVLVGALFGLVACLALVFNFTYWRATVILTSSVYLLLHVIRIARMTALVEDRSLLPALAFYYSISWRVTGGMFEEKGLPGGLTHAYLEYVMPLLAIALIVVLLRPARLK